MSRKSKMANTDDEHADAPEVDSKISHYQRFINTPAYMSPAIRRHILQFMVKNLPENAQKRVKALKKLQVEYLQLEAKFYEEVYAVERKYQELYQPLANKRKQIIIGEHEPTDAEADFKSDNEDDSEDVTEDMTKMAKEFQKTLEKHPADLKGVPDFWLTIFKSVELLSDMVQPHDEPILKKLLDIKIIYEETPMAYTLEFHFGENEWFKDTVLTKQYFLRCQIDEDKPFTFGGPEIYKCTGCTINWNPSKNVTVKTIKKKQKHKARGAVRTVTKTMPNDSFFNFFSPPDVPEDESKVDEDSQEILGTDFEIGHFLRASIVPKAALYYSGELVDDDDDDDDKDEEEEEEEEDEDQDDDDDADGGDKKNPAECQQQ